MADTSKGMGGGYTHDRNCYRRGGSCACGGGVCGKEVRATPPSPSTAPEQHHVVVDDLRIAAECVLKRWDSPLWRQGVGTAELMNRLRAALAYRPAEVDDELRAFASNLAKSQVAIDPEIASLVSENISELYASDDEVDDEGLPPLPKCVAYGFVGLGGLVPGDPHKQLIGVSVQSGGTHMQQNQVMLYTAEQYRQGQRDAVAADRARILRQVLDCYSPNDTASDYQDKIRVLMAAPSHTTNKEKGGENGNVPDR